MSRSHTLPGATLVKRYAAGESTVALGRHYGCSPTTIAKALREGGAVMRPARFRSTAVPEAALREQYLAERLSIAQIAANFGVSASTIGNKRRLYGIAPRPRRRDIGG